MIYYLLLVIKISNKYKTVLDTLYLHTYTIIIIYDTFEAKVHAYNDKLHVTVLNKLVCNYYIIVY